MDDFDAVYPSVKGKAGLLSQVGFGQQRTLAQRMIHRYPAVFRRGVVVEAESSIVPRCVESMHSFCVQMPFDVLETVDTSHMAYLDIKPVRKFDTRSTFDSLALTGLNVEAIYSRFFIDADVAQSVVEPMNFIQSLYYFVCHLGSAGVTDIDLDYVFTTDELALLHELDNRKFRYNCGASCNVEAARLLFQNFQDCAINDIKSGKRIVRLRFGHDNSLMSLLCLMGHLDGNWDCSSIPMAANIQWIFARNRKGHVLVKIQLNESDITGWEDFCK